MKGTSSSSQLQKHLDFAAGVKDKKQRLKGEVLVDLLSRLESKSFNQNLQSSSSCKILNKDDESAGKLNKQSSKTNLNKPQAPKKPEVYEKKLSKEKTIQYDFKHEIERRFQISDSNKNYQYPRVRMELKETDGDSGDDSFQSMIGVTVYNLNEQNYSRLKKKKAGAKAETETQKADSLVKKSLIGTSQSTKSLLEKVNLLLKERASPENLDLNKSPKTATKDISLIKREITPEPMLKENKAQDCKQERSSARPENPEKIDFEKVKLMLKQSNYESETSFRSLLSPKNSAPQKEVPLSAKCKIISTVLGSSKALQNATKAELLRDKRKKVDSTPFQKVSTSDYANYVRGYNENLHSENAISMDLKVGINERISNSKKHTSPVGRLIQANEAENEERLRLKCKENIRAELSDCFMDKRPMTSLSLSNHNNINNSTNSGRLKNERKHIESKNNLQKALYLKLNPWISQNSERISPSEANPEIESGKYLSNNILYQKMQESILKQKLFRGPSSSGKSTTDIEHSSLRKSNTMNANGLNGSTTKELASGKGINASSSSKSSVKISNLTSSGLANGLKEKSDLKYFEAVGISADSSSKNFLKTFKSYYGYGNDLQPESIRTETGNVPKFLFTVNKNASEQEKFFNEGNYYKLKKTD